MALFSYVWRIYHCAGLKTKNVSDLTIRFKQDFFLNKKIKKIKKEEEKRWKICYVIKQSLSSLIACKRYSRVLFHQLFVSFR